ncbi:MAG: HNH endonuclease [Aliarcobacter sp.]|nr:HNH endonuclease [Aliarcobacter sp.]
MIKNSIVIGNLSWNNSGWENPLLNPKAHHKYAKKFPGHESLNFKFDKSIDIENEIYGYVEINNAKFRKFLNGGVFIFYSNNTEINLGQIVGIYANVKTLETRKETKYEKFENDTLFSNIKANKNLSLRFPYYLNSDKYKKYTKGNRLVGQRGISYYDDMNILKEIIIDELKELEKDNIYSKEIDVLKNIYQIYLKEEINYDVIEQEEIEQTIHDIPDLTDNISETITLNGKVYKRNNVLISRIKRERKFKCQICNETIKKSDGSFYIEAAHIIPKKDKGSENKENILILCPNHHKEFDYGKRKIIKHTKQEIVFELNENKHNIKFTI